MVADGGRWTLATGEGRLRAVLAGARGTPDFGGDTTTFGGDPTRRGGSSVGLGRDTAGLGGDTAGFCSGTLAISKKNDQNLCTVAISSTYISNLRFKSITNKMRHQ